MWVRRSTPAAWAYAPLIMSIDGRVAGSLRWTKRRLYIPVAAGEHEVRASLGVLSAAPLCVSVSSDDDAIEVIWSGLSTPRTPISAEDSLRIRVVTDEGTNAAPPALLNTIVANKWLVVIFVSAAILLSAAIVSLI